MKVKKSGVVLAGVAAALLASGVVSSAFANEKHHEGKVKCEGVNSCKGKGSCKSSKNACKGQNSCKGQGWVEKKDAAECNKDGGKVMVEEAKAKS